MSVNIRLQGDVEGLLRRMEALSGINKNAILASAGESIKTSTVERFREERSPDGTRWRGSIRAEQTGDKTLTDTEVLRKSIHRISGSNSVAVGTNVIYAATHQFGDERTIRARNSDYLKFKVRGRWVNVREVRVTIPARPFLGISDEDKDEIREIIEDAVREAGGN